MSAVDRKHLQEWRVNRNSEAFRRIVHNYGAMVYLTCSRVLCNAADAEEVAQECFEILATANTMPDGLSLGPWLHGVATKRSLMWLRSQRRRVTRETAYAMDRPQTTEYVWDDIYHYVDEAVAALPDELRIPVIRHFLQGESHRAVGRALGLPHRTVGERIKRGVERVRKDLLRKGIVIGGAALAALLRENLFLTASLPVAFAATLDRLLTASSGSTIPEAPASPAIGASLVVKSLLVSALILLLGLYWAMPSAQVKNGSLENGRADRPQSLMLPGETHRDSLEPSRSARTRLDVSSPPAGDVALNSADVLVLAVDMDLTGAELGESATIIGDVTGDDVVDYVLGAPRANLGEGYEASGRGFIFDGATGRVVDTLDTPAPEPRCNTNDCMASGFFPRSLATIQDINGNGHREIVAGAKDEREGGFFAAGHVYLFDSLTGEHLRTLVTPNLQHFANLGAAIAAVPDITGDGIDEIVVGAEQESPNGINAAGRAYIIDAAAGTFLHTLESPDLPDCHIFGTTVSALADVDGDGCADVVIGQGSNGMGGAHIFSGKTGRLIGSLRSPTHAKDSFGTGVLGIPDYDGDGFGDIMVAAQGPHDSNNRPRLDKVYVLSGASGSVIRALQPPEHGQYLSFGVSLAYHNDFTGDGHPDFMIAGKRQDSPGTIIDVVCVFSALDGSYQGTLRSPNPRKLGRTAFGSYSILPVPDANHDGLDEVLITAPREGRSYVVYSPLAGATSRVGTGTTRAAYRETAEEVSSTESAPEFSRSIPDAPSRVAESDSHALSQSRPSVGQWLFSLARRLLRTFTGDADNADVAIESTDQMSSDAVDNPPEISIDYLGCRPHALTEKASR